MLSLLLALMTLITLIAKVVHGLQAKNEVKVLNSLNHPNIVKYYECYQERNMMHIIMEFCQVNLPLLYSYICP